MLRKWINNAELVETIIGNLKRGKAAGLDGVTSEHLQYSHPLLTCLASADRLLTGFRRFWAVVCSKFSTEDACRLSFCFCLVSLRGRSWAQFFSFCTRPNYSNCDCSLWVRSTLVWNEMTRRSTLVWSAWWDISATVSRRSVTGWPAIVSEWTKRQVVNVWLETRRQLNKVTAHVLTLPNATIQLSTAVNVLGVLLDSQLTMADHVAALCQSCFFQLPGTSAVID